MNCTQQSCFLDHFMLHIYFNIVNIFFKPLKDHSQFSNYNQYYSHFPHTSKTLQNILQLLVILNLFQLFIFQLQITWYPYQYTPYPAVLTLWPMTLWHSILLSQRILFCFVFSITFGLCTDHHLALPNFVLLHRFQCIYSFRVSLLHSLTMWLYEFSLFTITST